MAQKVICVHSTWLWKEKKSSHHICDANYAVRGPRKPVAHLLLPEKSFRRKIRLIEFEENWGSGPYVVDAWPNGRGV